mgnify:CR=1 FL=1
MTFSGDQGLEVVRGIDELRAAVHAMAVLRPLHNAPDSRVDSYIRPVEPHWLRRIVFADLRPYAHVFVASLIANLMALAGVIFSMQVYDRVIPAQSQPTLYVLFGGVVLALLCAWAMRDARTRIADLLGKRADLRISDRVFGHALHVRNTARPRTTGTFVSQLRELEPVREMLTSTTVAAVADLPFFLIVLRRLLGHRRLARRGAAGRIRALAAAQRAGAKQAACVGAGEHAGIVAA